MPPKKQDQGGKKALEKKKKAKIEDATFGLKNKNKSKKVQQFVKAVESSVAHAGQNTKQRREDEKLKAAKEDMKLAKAAFEMEKEALFKAVVNKTVVPAGVDPKSVLCEFYKAGKCVRGAKCKYSHDMEQARKTAKIDLYSDPRALLQTDTIDKWDTEKLNEVVSKKLKGKLPPTDIVCKYFLDAIENSQYGWFWECPSGADCHYRHCLPPGFILKTKADKERAKNEAEDEEEETIEEKIDAQRKALDLSKCTPITLELFKKWKADKEARRIQEVEKKVKDAEKKSTGSGVGVMSGRDLFRYDPSLFVDDDAADDEAYQVDEEYDPATNEEEDDENAKNYDSQAESVEDDGEEGEDEEDEDDDGQERKGDGGDEDDEDEDDDQADGDGDDDESAQPDLQPASKAKTAKKDDPAVAKAASAIDSSLFLDDEDIPDE